MADKLSYNITYNDSSAVSGVGTATDVGVGPDNSISCIDQGTNLGINQGTNLCVDQGTDMDLARILRDQGTNTAKIFRDIGADLGGASVRGRGLFLDPICESESEASLLGGDFKPRTFDDNLASYFQEVGPLEEEKSVEEIFVS